MRINQYIQIGSKIKEARLAKGIKQNKMAELLGISVSTYSNYENNYREPKLDLIHQICDILGVQIDELLGISQFEPHIADQIYNHLLHDDIVAVKTHLSGALQKLTMGKNLEPKDEELLREFFASETCKGLLPSTPKHTVYISTDINTSHPYKKYRRGEKLTTEEEEQLRLYMQDALNALPTIFKNFGESLQEYYQALNDEGQKKADEQLDRALEQIEMLTKIPEYQKVAFGKAVYNNAKIQKKFGTDD